MAMSAMACATARSCWSSAVLWVENRLSAPITSERSRIGTAETDFEAALARVRREERPARVCVVERVAADRGMGWCKRRSRAFFDLQLEELDEPHLFARARDVSQLSVGVGEHDPGFGDVEKLDATLRERLHEVDEVVGVDEGVRQRDERLDQELFAFHDDPFRTAA